MWLKATFFLLFPCMLFICCCTTSNTETDTETDTGTGYRDTVVSTDSATDSASDTGEDTGLDTSDGQGGVDEECYTYTNDDSVLMWCDTKELIVTECADYASGCCCRAPCEPSMCEGDDETLPCTVYDAAERLGYCDYAVDNVPISYECIDICTPRSECDVVDTDGSCLDTDASLDGICLIAGADTDNDTYCQPQCDVASCDDTHFCSPLIADGYYDGTGACLPVFQ